VGLALLAALPSTVKLTTLSSDTTFGDTERVLGDLGRRDSIADWRGDRRLRDEIADCRLFWREDTDPKESLECCPLLLAVLRSVNIIGLCKEGDEASFETEERYAHVEADCRSDGGRVARCAAEETFPNARACAASSCSVRSDGIRSCDRDLS